MFDGQQLGEQLTVVVRDYVARSTATMTVQIDELRQAIKAIPAGEKGDRGEKGEPGVGLVGPEGPAGAPGIAGANGKDADEGFILGAVQRAADAIPRPIVDYDKIADEIAGAIKAVPPAKDGTPGRDGKDADPEVVKELVAEQAKRATESAADRFVTRLLLRLEAPSV